MARGESTLLAGYEVTEFVAQRLKLGVILFLLNLKTERIHPFPFFRCHSFLPPVITLHLYRWLVVWAPAMA